MSNKANRKPKQNIDVLSSSEEHDEQDDDEEEYEVEKILDSRINPKTKAREYLVKWESKNHQNNQTISHSMGRRRRLGIMIYLIRYITLGTH